MTQYKKTYVNVLAYFSPDGSIHPLCIAFENGTCYLIDRVLRVVTAVSTMVGGCGMRYTVRILGKEKYLFMEPDGKWFIERGVQE